MNTGLRILLVEDNPGDALLVKELMATSDHESFELVSVDRLSAASSFLEEKSVDVIFLDLGLPDSHGLDTLRAVSHIAPEIPIVVLTGNDDEQVGIEAVKSGAQDYLVKAEVNTGGLLARVARYARERHQSQQTLRESENFLRTILDAQPNGVVQLTPDRRIIWANTTIADMADIPREKMIGESCFNVFYQNGEPCPDCPVASVVKKKHAHTRQQTHADGRTLSLHCNPVFDKEGEIESLVIVAEDVTEKLNMEIKLRQAQKMEALGTLAGGIAHDFNNILSCIIGFSQLASRQVPEGSAVSKHIKEIFQAGIRATDLVRQILTFSRQSETTKHPLRIGPVVKESLKLLRSTLPTTISIEQHIPAQVDPILADPTQIHQIIMNLCTNASHAMQTSGGVLSVTIDHRELDPALSRRHSDLQPGRYVVLEIGDTGCGMEADIFEDIFDPYFTTKEVGEGTGLGLAVVLGIVKDAGGDITVQSTVGQGSIFTLFFPVAEQEEQEALPGKNHESVQGGSEKILVVDDEPVLLRMYTSVLEDLGYTVVTATNGQEALDAFRNAPEDFDLVLTDYTMPKMRGDQLAQKILEIRPDMPIILSTGFSKQIDEAEALAMGISSLLLKPVSQDVLAREIRKALEEAAND